MGRILAIDYGKKRCGIAVTDSLQIIASGLDTVPTEQLVSYLEEYCSTEDVTSVVIGEPRHSDGTLTKLNTSIDAFVKKIKKIYPNLTIHKQDESFTSLEAKEVILQSGVNKKKRRNKSLVDKISAAIILQRYLEERRNK